jgi:hypothetical protein
MADISRIACEPLPSATTAISAPPTQNRLQSVPIVIPPTCSHFFAGAARVASFSKISTHFLMMQRNIRAVNSALNPHVNTKFASQAGL